MYQAKSGVKNFFPLLGGGGGGSLDKQIFPQSEHVSMPNLVSKNFFPLLGGGGGPLTKKFFSGLNMYQAKSGDKKIFPLLGGGGGNHST